MGRQVEGRQAGRRAGGHEQGRVPQLVYNRFVMAYFDKFQLK
jgi:hypothetical protein